MTEPTPWMMPAEMIACPACGGMGEVRGREFGMPWYECRACGGAGEMTEVEVEDYFRCLWKEP